MLPEQNLVLLVTLLRAWKLLTEGYCGTVREAPESTKHGQRAALANGVAKPRTFFMMRQFLTICGLPYAGILKI